MVFSRHRYIGQVRALFGPWSCFPGIRWKCFIDALSVISLALRYSKYYPGATLKNIVCHANPIVNENITTVYQSTWWRHQMETFSALLALCAGNSPVPGEFPTQRPVTRSFDNYFDLRPNKRLSKQWWGWWFETQSCPLWCHRNENIRSAYFIGYIILIILYYELNFGTLGTILA